MVIAAFMFLTSAFAAWAANNITITFVRHGESEGNVSCCIDTTIPGPNLTANGQAQAQARAQQLANDGIPYDGSIVNMGLKDEDGNIRYIIGVLKSIRKELGKSQGDTVHVTVSPR